MKPNVQKSIRKQPSASMILDPRDCQSIVSTARIKHDVHFVNDSPIRVQNVTRQQGTQTQDSEAGRKNKGFIYKHQQKCTRMKKVLYTVVQGWGFQGIQGDRDRKRSLSSPLLLRLPLTTCCFSSLRRQQEQVQDFCAQKSSIRTDAKSTQAMQKVSNRAFTNASLTTIQR